MNEKARHLIIKPVNSPDQKFEPLEIEKIAVVLGDISNVVFSVEEMLDGKYVLVFNPKHFPNLTSTQAVQLFLSKG